MQAAVGATGASQASAVVVSLRHARAVNCRDMLRAGVKAAIFVFLLMLMAAACTQPIATSTPTPEPSSAPTSTPTRAPTAGPTATAKPELTPTAILTRPPTTIPTPTATPTLQPTPTVTPTPNATPTPQPTPTPPLVPCSTPTPVLATTPATSGPLALVFDRSLPGGPITGFHVNMILYRFRVIGLHPGDAIQSLSLQLPYPPHSACRPDGSDGVVLSLFPWTLESGTHVVALELADGRRAEGTFEHVRTTPAGRPWPPCSPWLPSIEATLAWLSTPEGFCLIKFTDPADWPDPLCAPCPPAWEIWCNESAGPCDSVTDTRRDAKVLGQGHEICHGHQVWQILQAGLYKPGGNPTQPWLGTPQGRAFLLAVGLVLADTKSTGFYLPLDDLGERPVEDFANICSHWALASETVIGGIEGQEWVSNWHPALLRFVQEWLPK